MAQSLTLDEDDPGRSSGSDSGRRGFRFARGVARWLLSLVLTLAGLLVVTFAMTRLSPIDPALQLVGDHASASSYQAAREALGLDRPLPIQFLRYAAGVLHGDLGQSTSTGAGVANDLARTYPATLELATVAIVFGALIGLALGILAARFPASWVDGVTRVVSLTGYSVPIFWLGLLLLLLFYARLGWLPGPGRLDVTYQYTVEPWSGFALIDTLRAGDADAFRSALSHIVLPATVLAFHALAGIARLTRGALLDQLNQEYVLTARAKGADDWRIVLVHALPNVSGTLLTVVALSYASVLEGAVLTETVFAWPGIGRYLTTAMFAGDAAAVLGATLVIGASFVVLNSLTDLVAAGLSQGRGP